MSMSKLKRYFIWTAHAGRGQRYIAIENPEIRSTEFQKLMYQKGSRRRWGHFPGLTPDDYPCGIDDLEAGGIATEWLVAPAEAVGAIERGIPFSAIFGPIGFDADDGKLVQIGIEAIERIEARAEEA